MSDDQYKIAYKREKLSRQSAERILEEKSLELYDLNQKLILSNESLEEKVRERTNQLLKEKERAEKLASMKTEFLSMMSHEMRTPLNGILGYSSLLSEESLSELQLDYLSRISYSGKVLLSIINNVLEHSRLEASKLHVNKAKFNLEVELVQLFKIFEISALNKKISYEFKIEKTVSVSALIDIGMLKQICINLIGNAIKFTNNGGVRILVNVFNKQTLEIRVCDTGVGIEKEKQKEIFQPFMQVENENSYKYKGTGLGLSITQKMVDALKGRIEVESEVKKGTVFTCYLPIKVVADTERVDLEIQKKTTSTEEKIKVLIVDDNQLNRDLLQRILNKRNVDTEIAVDGREAVEQVKKLDCMFDFIFMDLRMPVLDGLKATKIINKLGFKGKIILLSAEPIHRKDDAELLKKFDGYLSKPYKVNDIIDILKH